MEISKKPVRISKEGEFESEEDYTTCESDSTINNEICEIKCMLGQEYNRCRRLIKVFYLNVMSNTRFHKYLN